MELTVQSDEFSSRLETEVFDLKNKYCQSLEQRQREYEIQLQSSIDERNEYYSLKITDMDYLYKSEKEIAAKNQTSLQSHVDAYKKKYEHSQNLVLELQDKLLELDEVLDSVKVVAQKSIDLKSMEIEEKNGQLEALNAKLNDQNVAMSTIQLEIRNLQMQVKESKEQVNTTGIS